MESAYEPPISELTNTRQKRPRSIAVTVLLSILVGSSIAMLYLARPIRFVVYLAIVAYSALYKPLLGIEFLGETDLLDSISYLVLTIIGTVDAVLICRKIPQDMKMPLYSRWYVIVPTIVIVAASVLILRTIYVEPFTIPSHSMRPTYVPGDMIYVDKRKSSLLTSYGQILHRYNNKNSSELAKRGKIVMYFPNGRDKLFLGRVIGLPGEKFEFYGHHFNISRCTGEDCTEIETSLIELREQSLMMGGDNGRPKVMGSIFTETIDGTSNRVLHSNEPDPQTIRLLKQQVIIIPKNHVLLMGDNRDNSMDNRFTGTVPISSLVGEVF